MSKNPMNAADLRAYFVSSTYAQNQSYILDSYGYDREAYDRPCGCTRSYHSNFSGTEDVANPNCTECGGKGVVTQPASVETFYLNVAGTGGTWRGHNRIMITHEVGKKLEESWKKNEHGRWVGMKKMPAILAALGAGDKKDLAVAAKAVKEEAARAEAARLLNYKKSKVEEAVGVIAKAALENTVDLGITTEELAQLDVALKAILARCAR